MLTQWSDGHNHLYLYNYDQADPGAALAKLDRQLTKGDFEVGEVLRVDHAARQVFYQSNEGNVLEQQIWQVSFDGERKQLSAGIGFHTGNFAPTGSAFVDRQSSRMEAPTLRLCAEPGKCDMIWSTKALEPYHLRAPEQLEVKAHDGATLYATLEPCAMCAGALVAARVARLVFGARDLRFGGVRSKFQIADSDLLNHRVEVVENVLAVDCVELLREFFEKRR